MYPNPCLDDWFGVVPITSGPKGRRRDWPLSLGSSGFRTERTPGLSQGNCIELLSKGGLLTCGKTRYLAIPIPRVMARQHIDDQTQGTTEWIPENGVEEHDPEEPDHRSADRNSEYVPVQERHHEQETNQPDQLFVNHCSPHILKVSILWLLIDSRGNQLSERFLSVSTTRLIFPSIPRSPPRNIQPG